MFGPQHATLYWVAVCALSTGRFWAALALAQADSSLHRAVFDIVVQVRCVCCILMIASSHIA